ncbi:restriction endonuclease subunit S [Ensifer sp. B1-9]|uniref:restriction endonuclease subunit S n=1 Tax=Ensifer sp. B1-9 TaxID=3141455 RepID=UPI003D1C8B25
MKIAQLTLAEVTDLLTDGTHYTPPNVGKGVPFLTVKDVSEQGLDFMNCSRISREEFENARKQNSAPTPGDVLFSKDGTVGKVHLVRETQDFAVLSSLAILRPSRMLAPEYLAHFLRSATALDAATKKKTGSAIRRIVLRDLATLSIPLPPIDEQKRIAAILDKADQLRKKRRRAIALLDEAINATFWHSYSRSAQNTRAIRFSDIAINGSGNFGNGPFGSDLLTSELQDSGVPVIYIRDIRDGEYKRVSSSFVTETKAEALSSSAVRPGDVLISKVGDPPGVAAVYPDGEPDGIVTQDVIRIRVNEAICLKEYLRSFLNSSLGKHLIKSITVAATRARFSLRDLKSIEIPLPSVVEQAMFAKHVAALEREKKQMELMLVQSDILFSSLQHRAFSGQL